MKFSLMENVRPWKVSNFNYLCGKPVDGKSVFRGTVGLGAVVATCAGVDANTTEPPSEPCKIRKNIKKIRNQCSYIQCQIILFLID